MSGKAIDFTCRFLVFPLASNHVPHLIQDPGDGNVVNICNAAAKGKIISYWISSVRTRSGRGIEDKQPLLAIKFLTNDSDLINAIIVQIHTGHGNIVEI